MQKDRPYRIMLSGGGTGGHIFPAIAIANQIVAAIPDAEILFVGAIGKMEMEKVPRAGFKIVGLPVSAFHRRFTFKNLVFPFKLLASMIKAFTVVTRFKPDLVIGTGGFASGPVLKVAARKGIPTLLQEQNSYPGVTNRLLAQKASRICVAYPDMDRWFPGGKITITGNPVRSDLRIPDNKLSEARSSFKIKGNRPVILIFGGSQGARTLNQSLFPHIRSLAQMPVDIIWQTGTAFYPTAKTEVAACDAKHFRVTEFIYEMNFAYALASLVVCRSGAITLSELAVLGKPAILVPLPSAAENHQAKNAQAYVDAGAALLVNDTEAPAKLVDAMLELINDPSRLKEMAANMTAFAKPNAVQEITEVATKLLNF